MPSEQAEGTEILRRFVILLSLPGVSRPCCNDCNEKRGVFHAYASRRFRGHHDSCRRCQAASIYMIGIAATSEVEDATPAAVVAHTRSDKADASACCSTSNRKSSLAAAVWLEFFILVAVGIGLSFTLGYGAALILSGFFSQSSGVNLPVGFAGGDGTLAMILLAFAAVLAALPAVLAYRQSPAQALRG